MIAEIGRRLVGQRDAVDGVVTALLAGGHALLEGVPGLGKTLLVRTLGETLDLSFSRIQFTPDLMPSDVTGTHILVDDDGGGRRLEFQRGPIFAHLVLADEINRATPKTQSALLEAMQEQSVTVGKTTHALPAPFFVLATQNPIEMEGTYPLPEAQLDRFFFKVRVPYPDRDELHAILERTTGDDEPHVAPRPVGRTPARAAPHGQAGADRAAHPGLCRPLGSGDTPRRQRHRSRHARGPVWQLAARSTGIGVGRENYGVARGPTDTVVRGHQARGGAGAGAPDPVELRR